MKIANIIAPVLFAAALVSCGKERPEPATSGRTAVVPAASLDAAPASRANLSGPVIGTTFPESTENLFSVTAYKRGDESGPYEPYFDNEAVKSDDNGRLRFHNFLYYPFDPVWKLYFYAYSPSAEEYIPGTFEDGPTVAWTIDGQQDIMYARDLTGIGRAVSGVQPQPEFEFRHLLKQIRFRLVRGAGFSDNISSTSIKIINCRTRASLNLATGELTFSGDYDQSVTLAGNCAIHLPEQAVVFGILMCEDTDKLDMQIEAAGVTYNTTVALERGAGISHQVSLTFEGTQIIAEASVAEWVDVGRIEASEYIK